MGSARFPERRETSRRRANGLEGRLDLPWALCPGVVPYHARRSGRGMAADERCGVAAASLEGADARLGAPVVPIGPERRRETPQRAPTGEGAVPYHTRRSAYGGLARRNVMAWPLRRQGQWTHAWERALSTLTRPLTRRPINGLRRAKGCGMGPHPAVGPGARGPVANGWRDFALHQWKPRMHSREYESSAPTGCVT